MNNLKKVLSLFLVLVMCMGILPSTALAATNSKGMTYSATAGTNTLETSASTQKVVVSVTANQAFPVDAIGMTVIIPEGWSLEAIENEDLGFAPSNLNLAAGKVNYVTPDAENWSTKQVAKITYIVPANVAAGDYSLGIKELVISEDYGTVWENGGTATTTVTVKGKTEPDPGAISYSAKLDVSTIDTSASTQKVVVSVKANQKFPVDAIGMTVIIPEGWSLEAIENEDLTFAPSNLNLAAGKVNYVTSDAENWSTDWVAKITYIVPANVAAGEYTLGIKELVISKDYGTVWENGGTAKATLTVKGAPVHTCSGTFTKGQAATCTVDGWKDYYTCSCGKYYSDSACNNEITDLAAWKAGDGKIAASHDYGTLVDEDPGVHTATEVKDGMKAHYFCDTCDTYFDSSKNPTTKAALTIKNEHSYDTQYGYKGTDGHADTCSCGAHNTVVGHTPDIPAPTEDDDQVCKYCGFVIATKTGHIHKNNLTPVAENGATCTDDGYKAHYHCSCGLYFEDASASVEIDDIDAWKAGDGKIAKKGHDYTEQIKDAAHLKSEATKCTEFDVYWYDCSRCSANAKDDPNATDKFWTSTDAGEHKFDEKLTDAAHLVAGTGANCQDAKKYYFDCAYCAEIGTSTWTSTSYGDHKFDEKIPDAAHLVAGTGVNCQDAKEYYYDCAHCAEIGTTSWVSTEMGDHDFDTTQWGYKDKATGHAHKCKYCTEHDTVQSHTPGAPATETDDQICTTCLLVLEPATGHICKSHLTQVPANGATCTVDGNIEYYECSCGKYYTDSTAAVEITDKNSVVVEAGHNYGTLIPEEPAKHTATELKAGMKAHYFCDKCSTYFTAEKVATTESDLVIPAPVHEYNTVNGYKEADGHADTCSCGAHNTVVPHTPDREAATETDPIKCSVCGYEIAPALGHTCKNNLTKVAAEPATCTKDGNIEYYTCSCGKWYTDATASVEITDKDSVVIKAGHNYGTEWKSDEDNHWNECAACSDKANTAAHKDDNSDGKCDVCEYNVGVPSQPGDNPQTGDNSNMILWISLLMLSALGVVATTIIGKRKYSVK